jgi:hypothetical protein
MVSPKVTETIKKLLSDKPVEDEEIEFTLPPFVR